MYAKKYFSNIIFLCFVLQGCSQFSSNVKYDLGCTTEKAYTVGVEDGALGKTMDENVVSRICLRYYSEKVNSLSAHTELNLAYMKGYQYGVKTRTIQNVGKNLENNSIKP